MANLWAGRFEKSMDALVEQFNASIGFDIRMYDQDISASIAHVTMLGEQGIVTHEEKEQIVKGLEEIRKDIAEGRLTFGVHHEDIHMAVEETLIGKLGDTGKRLHTARSRNDQCQVDHRLYLRDEIDELTQILVSLEKVLLEKAEAYADKIMVGFTHMQHAQPLTVGFHLMAYFQMFLRDIERLQDCRERLNINPLGSCALAGTTLPINRQRTTELLDFSAPCENAMDAVSDRDYILEFLSAASISMMHISRFAEEMVYWNSQEFSYIAIDDSFCTGSSIMPQKKNPDIAELLRGKVGRIYGHLMAVLTVMKGTPLSFNKDFQEDKESSYDTVDTWKDSAVILREMIKKTEFRMDEIEKQLSKGFLAATDIAEGLVRHGLPFRQAHEIVGKMVKYCENKGCGFEDLTKNDLIQINDLFHTVQMPDLTMEGCVNARTSFGGTAPVEVRRQIEAGKQRIESFSKK